MVDNNAESHNDIPNMLEALDKVEPGPLPDERFAALSSFIISSEFFQLDGCRLASDV